MSLHELVPPVLGGYVLLLLLLVLFLLIISHLLSLPLHLLLEEFDSIVLD